ncbi:hemicentin-1, partial [Biomphalaria glabrata]
DCPEMSIGAIKRALEESLPYSFIYVFTDARSKDYYLTEEVLALIQQKQSQVVFVLTGDCGNVTHSGYRAYEEIAATSSGQVFLLQKSQVNQVLNFVRVAVQARKVNLLSVNEDEGKNQVFNLPLDTLLKEVTVSVSGENPEIILKDPEGKTKVLGNKFTELLNLSNVRIVNIKEPTPGNWRLRVSSSGTHSIRVTGLSSADFVAGFSKYPTRDFSKTNLRPIQGIATNILVNSTGLEEPSILNELELVDLKGKTLVKFPLTQDPDIQTLYNVSSFVPPDKYFYIKVTGTDDAGYVLQRTTPTAISPLKAKSPKVVMQATTHAFYDSTVTLVCQVHSYVPYRVQWSYNGKQQGYDLFYEDPTNVTLEIPNASSLVEGEYHCNVSNSAGYHSASTYLDVSDPPPAIVTPENVTVMPGEIAILSCIVISTVPYNLTWRHGSHFGQLSLDPRIRIYNNDSMIIYNVDRHDEGTYSCTAQNEGGSSTETLVVRLKVKPVAQIFPREQTFVAGSSKNFTCIAGGYPEPTFLWQQDNEIMPSGGRVHIEGGYLVLKNLKPSDEGEYECVASNSAGSHSVKTRLIYIEAPHVREIDKKLLVAVGDDARLSCVADGIPPPNTTWYRSDIMLQPAYNVEVTRSGQLVIADVVDSDAGTYRCVVQNEAGSDSAELTLEVGSPPEITLPPENTGIDIESNGSLLCQAIGRPTPKLSWRRKDGRPIDFNGRFKQTQPGLLEITNIQQGDEGYYTCVAQNPFDTAEFDAYVSVTGIVRPLIAYTSPFVKAIIGENAELECIVMLGKPKPKLNWLRNGQLLRESDRVRLREPGRIIITNVQEDDKGDYLCMASNIGGNETYNVNLDVLVPPRLLEDEENLQTNFSVTQGKTIVLPCNVDAHPPASFSWFKGGSPISFADIRYYIRNDGALEIFSVDSQDTAQYKCVASNVAGEMEKNINLFVEVPPQIAGDLEEAFEINQGESILLPCQVTGIPKPVVTWKQNLLPLNPDGVRVQIQSNGLYISSAETSDKAMYECWASNVAGDAYKAITLQVFTLPTIEPGPTEVTVLYGQPAVLECESDGTPRPLVLWKKEGVILDAKDDDKGYSLSPKGSLTINSVDLSDGGSYTCSATNPAGFASRDVSLIVHGAPEIPGIYSDYNEVVERNPIILPCPAVGTPKPVITWFKDNAPLSFDGSNMVLLDDGSLEIDNSRALDSGNYECIAENVAGVANRNFVLKVLVPPKLTGGTQGGGPDKPKVILDKNITLNCPVSEDTDPPPEFKWYKNNVEIVPDGRIFLTNAGRSLTIARSIVEDEARYRCVAKNVAGEVDKYFELDVQVPPTVDESSLSPFNQSVISGRTLYINCPIQGKPPPQVRWLKDGEPLVTGLDVNVRLQAEGRRLELINAQITDRGRYVCIGENIAGQTSRDFSVNVFVPPTVDQREIPEKSEVIQGQTVRMTCPASGIPLPTITWFRENVHIKANTSKVSLLDFGWTIEIRDTNVTDATRYYCRAENVAGQTEKVFDLDVFLFPIINKENIEFKPEVVVNNTAVFNCYVSGNPLPEILWYRNGVLIDATNNPRYEILAGGRQLRIYSVQVKDKAKYTCAANNRAGKDELDYDLSVLVTPRIERQGINVQPKVIANSTVSLSCPATGVPPPKIVWQKDGQVIESQPGVVEVRGNGTELVLVQAQVSDSGRYRCLASNQAGDDSINFQLSVHIPPSIPFEGLLVDTNVIENDTTILECPASGFPEPSILWYFNGAPLDPQLQPGLQISESGKRLVIQQTKVSDSGVYMCVASNEAGEAEQNYNVDVWVPPVIDRSAIESMPRVILGHTISINCPVSGIPFPTISWLKDGKELVKGTKVQILSNGLLLRISDAQEEDAGTYSCVAENTAGKDKVNMELAILVPPTIDESNVVYDRKVNMDRKVQLECPVHGTPTPSVEWLINGQPAENFNYVVLLNNKRILEIDKVNLRDTAQYVCVATNEAGQLERIFNLEVLIAPVIEKQSVSSNLVVVQNETVKINCPAKGIPEPDIMWSKERQPFLEFPYVDLRLLNDDQTLEISNAQLNDAGNYSCRASNPAGVDEMTFTLQVHVPPSIGKPTPDKLHVVEGQSISMRCSVTGLPEPSILWLKDGAVILEEKNGHKQILDNDTTLQIVDAHPVDRARYTCHAENQAGFAEKYFDLEVYEPAKINGSGKRVDVPVIVNQEVILNCPAEGVPTPTVTWFRKNTPIPPYGMPNIRIQDMSRQLVIISAQLLDFGDYSCLAKNDAGEDRLHFVVSIMVPPDIEEGPTEVAGKFNDPILLHCETSGQPTPVVTWTKNGQAFPSTSLRHRILPTGSLEFMLVRLEDNGVYQCTATNAAGSATRSIQLQVQIPAKILSRTNLNIRASERETVILTCEVEGFPAPTTYWLKNRKQLDSDVRMSTLSNGSLYIASLDRKDAGVYTCITMNSAGTDSKDIRLRVLEPPEIYASQTEFTVLQNRTVTLPCQANGRPRPKIFWEKDGKEIQTSTNQRQSQGRLLHYITMPTGGLVITHTRSEDAGVYKCVAENNAGQSFKMFRVTVQVPPTIEAATRQYIVSVGERVTLPCKASGSPVPTILWTKDRRRIDPRIARIRVEPSGSLTIESITGDDTGEYTCTAESDVGTDSQSRLLRVKVPPVFVTTPKDREMTINSNFQLKCAAKGVPTPVITWQLNGRPISAPASINGVSTITVRNVVKEDAGEYTCIATNPADNQQVTASARIIVKVPPRVIVPPSDWAVKIAEKVVLDCSVGGDPPPEILWTKNSRPVDLGDRIQKLGNGSLIIYDATASDAGNYKCIAVNDAGTSEAQSIVTIKSEPKFRVEPSTALVEIGDTVSFDCTAEGVPRPIMYWWKETQEIVSGGRITVMANNTLRIIATQQTDAGIYRCFASNPLGKTFVETFLNVVVHGEYSPWTEWGACSTSCGKGSKTRRRTCDNPRPENGGRDCIGPSVENTNCVIELCPVHGNWAPWSVWGECTLTCGGGQRKRVRTCSNPAPSGSGQPCAGSGEEMEYCNTQGCPVDGKFSEWSDWSACSSTCGLGEKKRTRECIQPSFGGRRCWGDTSQIMDCNLGSCFVLPRKAYGNLIGYINNVDIADAIISANIIPSENGMTRVEATVGNIPPSAAKYLQHLVSLLTPVYWSTAQEIDGAVNGYTLTKGNFTREVQVEFATGEVLKMSHYISGTDSKGNLQFDVIIRGEVPELGPFKNIHLRPFQEEYIQTGPGTIYAHSSRSFSGDGVILPYAWNHTINYESTLGQMPYLVQQLTTKGLQVEIVPGDDAISYVIEASIGPGKPSNRCPTGFQLESRQSYCKDDDECAQSNPCSHICLNGPGSFTCSCPIGFLLSQDSRTCQDINECSLSQTDCGPDMDCLNTPGSFRCVNACPKGFKRDEKGDLCVDRNECIENPSICEQSCQNLVGSYRCTCLPGYRLGDNGKCVDLDECDMITSPCSHTCVNTKGSFMCSCPSGYQLLNGRVCRDINECYEGGSNCRSGEECINKEGSFTCLKTCPTGYKRTESGQCQDIDECGERQHKCYYNQLCVNTDGAYRCDCPAGFTSRGPGQPCIDIDECRLSPRVCLYRCRNTWGSYECLCPPGQLQLADRKSCAGLEFLEPGRVLPADDEAFKKMKAQQQFLEDLANRQHLEEQLAQQQQMARQQEEKRSSETSALSLESITKKPRRKTVVARKPKPLQINGKLKKNQGLSALESADKESEKYGFYVLNTPRTMDLMTTSKYEKYYFPTPKSWRRRKNRNLLSIPDNCPEGFQKDSNDQSSCIDRDECAEVVSVCQHNCTNTRGSYTCSCPPGYRLEKDGYSCKDINECVEQNVNCGPEKMCFNQRGSYTCIDIPCPPDYARDPTTNYCVLECVDPNIPCPPGAKYADIIEFKTIALPAGSKDRQDLIRLTAYNQHDQYLPYTVFTVLLNDPQMEFLIRTDEGRGIVYTMEPLKDSSTYRITVRARSYDSSNRHIQYQTTFIIHISVSAYPY